MDSMTWEREEESERLKTHYEQLQTNYANSEVRLELSNIISTDGQCSSLRHVLPCKIAFSQGAELAQFPSDLSTSAPNPLIWAKLDSLHFWSNGQSACSKTKLFHLSTSLHIQSRRYVNTFMGTVCLIREMFVVKIVTLLQWRAGWPWKFAEGRESALDWMSAAQSPGHLAKCHDCF